MESDGFLNVLGDFSVAKADKPVEAFTSFNMMQWGSIDKIAPDYTGFEDGSVYTGILIF